MKSSLNGRLVLIIVLFIVCICSLFVFYLGKTSVEAKNEPIDPTTVTDSDGNVYQTVKIGEQLWMASNLKTTTFNDGEPIAYVKGNSAWGGLKSAAYCWANLDENNKEVYGALYNWFAVDSHKLAPKGWHVATDEDWKELLEYIKSEGNPGSLLKEKGTQYWLSPNYGATDTFGFSARPGGYRNYDGLVFHEPGDGGFFWTQTAEDELMAITYGMQFDNLQVERGAVKKTYGRSVRCVKDKEIK